MSVDLAMEESSSASELPPTSSPSRQRPNVELTSRKDSESPTRSLTPLIEQANSSRKRDQRMMLFDNNCKCTDGTLEDALGDTDSRDPSSESSVPLRASALVVSQPVTATARLSRDNVSFSSLISEAPVPPTIEIAAPPRLTLSAFRKSDTVRLTQCDMRRTLESEYDLYAPGCGVLGHGAFSTVRLAVRRRDKTFVAVKSIAKFDALRSRRLRFGGKRYLEEWEILKRMKNHPYVITLLDIFESNEEIQLVTEYCSGGELFNAIRQRRMRRYTETQAAQIVSQILLALQDLHAQGIVHRDVKCENVLLTSDDENCLHVKLCDFGVARSLIQEPATGGGDDSPLSPQRSRAFSMLGSNFYVAPEITHGRSYDTAVDMYSLGVTLYILLCGFPPIMTGPEHEAEALFPESYWRDISEEARSLVRRMLCTDSATRISAREALADGWIRRHMNLAAMPRKSSVNLDLVRSRLHKMRSTSLGGVTSTSPMHKSTLAPPATSPPRKRARLERRASSTLLALADLYRGVAQSPQASMAAVRSVRDTPIPDITADSHRKPPFRTQAPAALSF